MKTLATMGWSTALASAFGLLFAIFLLALLADALSKPWRRRRAAFMRDRELNRYSMGAFKVVTKDWRS